MRQFLTQLGLQAVDIQEIEAIFTDTITFTTGQFFIEEGATVKGIGFITKGAFRYFYNNDGADITRWVALEGDFVTSLSSFIDRKPTLEHIQAMKPTKIHKANNIGVANTAFFGNISLGYSF